MCDCIDFTSSSIWAVCDLLVGESRPSSCLSSCFGLKRWAVKEGAHDNDIILMKGTIVPRAERE